MIRFNIFALNLQTSVTAIRKYDETIILIESKPLSIIQ